MAEKRYTGYLKKLYGYKQIEIVECTICLDHMNLCIKMPPKLAITGAVGVYKE